MRDLSSLNLGVNRHLPAVHHPRLISWRIRLDVTNERNGVHLKDMVTKLSAEIVIVWNMFSSKIEKDLKKDMDNVLEKSIDEAEGIYPQIKEVLEV